MEEYLQEKKSLEEIILILHRKENRILRLKGTK